MPSLTDAGGAGLSGATALDTTAATTYTDINGLASAVSNVLNAKGFVTGTVGNNEGGHVKGSQVRAAKTDDLGAQEISKELGGLPVVADSSIPAGSVRVVLADDYTGPGSGLTGGGSIVPARVSDTGAAADPNVPAPSPILTAGSDKPECIN